MSSAKESRRSSLLHRVILIMTLVVTFSFMTFSLIIDQRQSALAREDVARTLKLTANLVSHSVANWFGSRVGLMEEVADRIAGQPHAAQDLLKNKALEDAFDKTYFGNEAGVHLRSSSKPLGALPANYDPRQRPWYKDAVSTQGPTLTAPYRDATANALVVTAAVPVMTQGRLAGVTGGDFFLNSLISQLDSIDFGSRGYAFIVDESGTILIHHDEQVVGRKWEDVFGAQPAIADIVEISAAGERWLMTTSAIEGLPGVKWRIAVAIDPVSAFAPIRDFRVVAAIITLVAVSLTIVLLGLLLSRGVSRPLNRITTAMKALAGGDLQTAVPDLQRHDEIGAMAKALEIFKRNTIERQDLEKRNRASEVQEQRAETVRRLIQDFNEEIGKALALIETSSGALERTAQSLNTTADISAGSVVTVSAAAEQASANVGNVASASGELAASVNEITRTVSESRAIADRASASVRETDTTAQQLVTASERINEIVALISSIAQQTNLLALNATIEAARAGDAGKGFAVVATEVKSLADQTARATGDIAEQIRAIQSVSHTAVSAIREVGSIIGMISSVFEEIASAVSRQGLATREIAENIHQAAIGTQQVSANMQDISTGSAETRDHAASVLASAAGLAQEADSLRQRVERFFEDIRTA